MSTMEDARQLAEATTDAYSVDRYSSWLACCRALLNRGYSREKAECILRSKITRWAADHSGKMYGRTSALDLLKYLDANASSVDSLFREAGLSDPRNSDGSALSRLKALHQEYLNRRAAANQLAQSPSRSRSATRAFERADETLEALLQVVAELTGAAQ